MKHTYWQHRETEVPGVEGRKVSRCFSNEIDYTDLTTISADWAGGGLRTNCEDLNRFLDAFINDSIFERRETLAEMKSWKLIDENVLMYYGMGIIGQKITNSAHKHFKKEDFRIGHHGVSGAFMYHYEKRNITIIGTLNQMYTRVNYLHMMNDIIEIIETP